jgi:hypothetical protein
MTLATKNGSLIVKDGKIAENCGCCEGGWYCCISEPCSVDEFVQSVTVNITTGADQVVVVDQSAPGFSCIPGQPTFTLHSRMVTIIQASHYAGSLSLSRQAANEWKYLYPPDTPGNVASVTATFFDGLWFVDLDFHSYAWRKTARVPISDTKTIADMSRLGGGMPTSIPECYSPPEELFFMRRESFRLLAGEPCENHKITASRSAILHTSFNTSGYAITEQTGASNISMTLSIAANT